MYEKTPFELSGGQKRRVAIAGVLAMNPEILILDEPTAGLDPAGRDKILNRLKELREKKGIGIVLVSHSMEDVANYAERIIVMNKGQVMYDDAPHNVFKHYKKLEQIGLAAPQITYIMHQLKEDGLDVDENIINLEEAKEGVRTLMLDKQFGSAGDEIVIEEFMTGREVSVLSFVDGKTIKIMTSAQDHKRAKDGDQGLNTGGMGTFSPSPFYTSEVDAFCREKIYQPTVDAMRAEGREFKGIIFFGLMLTEDGPKVLEYNARFGDPETQVVLPRMKNDLADLFEACIDGTLDQVELEFEDNAAVCVVLASDGYPEHYEKGYPISGLERFKDADGYFVFHAGTKLNDQGQIVTNGGRVLGVTATGGNLKEARANAYKATEWVEFGNKYMRNDIGHAIDEV